MTFDIENSSSKFLILLLLTDLVFILVHVLYRSDLVTNPLFSIKMDWGYAEVYQYTKEFWVILLLFFIAIKRAKIIYFAWFSLFMYLLLDDSLRIHENFGGYLVRYFGFQPEFGLRAQDFGELSVSILFGALLFLLIGSAYLFSNYKEKQISKHFFILVLFLAFFGVLVDTFHRAIAIPWLKPIRVVIEDGGEMLIMSIIVWYVFNLEFISQKTD